MGQIWGAGLSRELDFSDAEGPQEGDNTAGLCLTQPTVIALVRNPAWVSQLPLCPLPSSQSGQGCSPAVLQHQWYQWAHVFY